MSRRKNSLTQELAAYVRDVVVLFDVKPGEHAHIDGPGLIRLRERGVKLMTQYHHLAEMMPDTLPTLPAVDPIYQQRKRADEDVPTSTLKWRRTQDGVPPNVFMFNLIMSLKDLDEELQKLKTEVRCLKKETAK